MHRPELNILQRVGLEILWAVSRLFAVLPYWFKYYVVENLLFFVLYYCLRYRMKVVRGNLRRSFPEKSGRELRRICRGFYLSLSEVFVDTVNMAHMSRVKIRRIISVKDLDAHIRAVEGRDWVCLMAHYGCWEYGACWGYYDPSQLLVSVYHPLRNPVMECFYLRLRNAVNTVTVPMKECVRFYLRSRSAEADGRPCVLGLIADQNPPRRPDSRWFRFLNQDTIFFDGGEKLALRFRLPVYFGWLERIGRGRYRLRFERLYDGEEPVGENEITERYVRKLESVIRERPELWLWSHRRWKHKREDAGN